MKYLNVGINSIDETKFNPIKNRNSKKPFGGLWTTKYQNNGYSSMIDYYCNYPEFLENKYPGYSEGIPGVIITLKSDAKIFELDSFEKLQYLKDNFSLNDWFDYEKLAKYYDGISIEISKFKHKDDDPFKSFAVDTTILFNLESIESYEKITITIEETKLPYNTIYEHFLTYEQDSKVLKRTKPSV